MAKRDGADREQIWRLVADFRCLNGKTTGDTHPLPDIIEISDQLGQSKYFTYLDLVMVYQQTEMKRKGPKRPLAPSRCIGSTVHFPLG
jgi:hypothetical protein